MPMASGRSGPRPLTSQFVPIWLAVLIIQTAYLVPDGNTPPEDWAYVPVQVIILGIATLMIWAGSKLQARSAT